MQGGEVGQLVSVYTADLAVSWLLHKLTALLLPPPTPARVVATLRSLIIWNLCSAQSSVTRVHTQTHTDATVLTIDDICTCLMTALCQAGQRLLCMLLWHRHCKTWQWMDVSSFNRCCKLQHMYTCVGWYQRSLHWDGWHWGWWDCIKTDTLSVSLRFLAPTTAQWIWSVHNCHQELIHLSGGMPSNC